MNAIVLITALLWLITAITGGAAVVAFVKAARLASHGASIDGRIVAHAVDPEGANVCAVVEYTVAGVAYRVETNTYVALERLPIGASRRVVYLPSDPRQAQIMGANRFVKVIVLSAVTLLVGAPAAGLTYLWVWG